MVAHLLFHIRQRFTLLNEQAGEGVAQVVHPYIPELRFCQELMPYPMMEIRLIAASTRLCGEDPYCQIRSALASGGPIPLYKGQCGVREA